MFLLFLCRNKHIEHKVQTKKYMKLKIKIDFRDF